MREAGPYTGGGTALGCPPAEQIAEWVRIATLAPSMHNTQPWRFRVLRDSQTIQLRADPERMLPHGDPHGRAAPQAMCTARPSGSPCRSIRAGSARSSMVWLSCSTRNFHGWVLCIDGARAAMRTHSAICSAGGQLSAVPPPV